MHLRERRRGGGGGLGACGGGGSLGLIGALLHGAACASWHGERTLRDTWQVRAVSVCNANALVHKHKRGGRANAAGDVRARARRRSGVQVGAAST